MGGGAGAHRAEEVDVDHLGEPLHRQLRAAATDDARAVDQDIEPVEIGEELGDGVRIAHVQRPRLDRGVVHRHGLAGHAGREGPRAGRSEADRDGAADAARSADDEHGARRAHAPSSVTASSLPRRRRAATTR